MVQKATFHTGGFVLHKIPYNGQTYSAWFDKDGNLLDCERTTNHKTAHVPKNHKNVREALQAAGQRHK